MSRTKRKYGYGGPFAWELTFESIGLWSIHPDPRDKYKNGFDGASPQYYYSEWPPYQLKDCYKGNSRKYHKRKVAKAKRRIAKREIIANLY